MNLSSQSNSQTQTKRRVLFGFNTLIAIFAAIGVTAGVNWLAATQLENLPSSALQWLRFDVTRTRQYSLSEQTKNTLTQLRQTPSTNQSTNTPDHANTYRIVSLIPESDTQRRQAIQDLLEEYKSHAPNLEIEHIRQGFDTVLEDELYRQIQARYADELAPLTQAVDQGLQALDQTIDRLQEMAEATEQAENTAPAGLIKDHLTRARVELTKMVDVLIQSRRQIDDALARPMPRYQPLIKDEQGGLNAILHTVQLTLQSAQNRINLVKDRLRSDDLYRAARIGDELKNTLEQAVAALAFSDTSLSYDEAADTLSRGPAVVIFAPVDQQQQIQDNPIQQNKPTSTSLKNTVRVLSAQRMFITSNTNDPNHQTPESDSRFLGEELITGALLSLQLKPAPMVIFVTSGKTKALEPNGIFQTAARRLRAIGLTVHEWPALQRQAQVGAPYFQDPGLNRPKNGQAVYIFLPLAEQAAARASAMQAQQDEQRYLEVLDNKLQSQDGVFVLASTSQKHATGQSPLAAKLRPYGIAPLQHQVIAEEQNVGRLQEATMQIEFNTWPKDHIITQSLDGLPAMLIGPTPVAISDHQNSQSANQTTPIALVKLSGQRMWTLDSSELIQNKKHRYNPAQAAAFYTPIVATTIPATSTTSNTTDNPNSATSSRLVVASAFAWADDRLATVGRDGRPGTAALTGQLYPGNTELFINSVLWLANQDALIAASPRQQDIRRIESVSPNRLISLRWTVLGGIPTLIGVSGLLVWLKRRSG